MGHGQNKKNKKIHNNKFNFEYSVHMCTCAENKVSSLLLLRCGNTSTYQVSQTDMTSQRREEGDEIREHLSLPLSHGGDVTMECVASNYLGVARDIFHPGKLLK